jgi:hypothetical protein
MDCCKKIVDCVLSKNVKETSINEDLDDKNHTSINQIIKILVLGTGI